MAEYELRIRTDDPEELGNVVAALERAPPVSGGGNGLQGTVAPEPEPPNEDQDGDQEKENLLDHTNPEHLEQAYDEADGNIGDAAARFDVTYPTVYGRMVDAGVHVPDSNDQEDEPEKEPDDDRPVGCLDCGRAFDSINALSGHLNHDSTDCGWHPECEDCGDSFDSMQALAGHLNSGNDCEWHREDAAEAAGEIDERQQEAVEEFETRVSQDQEEPDDEPGWAVGSKLREPTPGDEQRLDVLKREVPVSAEEIFKAVAHPSTQNIQHVADFLEWDSTGAVRDALMQLDLYEKLPEPESHRGQDNQVAD